MSALQCFRFCGFTWIQLWALKRTYIAFIWRRLISVSLFWRFLISPALLTSGVEFQSVAMQYIYDQSGSTLNTRCCCCPSSSSLSLNLIYRPFTASAGNIYGSRSRRDWFQSYRGPTECLIYSRLTLFFRSASGPPISHRSTPLCTPTTSES